MEISITKDQALKRISDIAKLQGVNIEVASITVAKSYEKPLTSPEDLLVKLDRRIVEGLTSALIEAHNAAQLKIIIN